MSYLLRNKQRHRESNVAHRAVYKTRTAEFLDDFYRDVSRPEDTAFADALELLASSGPLSDTTRALQVRSRDPRLIDEDKNVDEAKRFHEAWLHERSKHGSRPVDRVLRLGYGRAIELAQERGLRIENFWVTGAGPDFELHICEGTDRIVCFMFVPDEDTREYGSRAATKKSWVVREGDIGEVDSNAPRVRLDNGDPPIMMIQVSG